MNPQIKEIPLFPLAFNCNRMKEKDIKRKGGREGERGREREKRNSDRRQKETFEVRLCAVMASVVETGRTRRLGGVVTVEHCAGIREHRGYQALRSLHVGLMCPIRQACHVPRSGGVQVLFKLTPVHLTYQF